MYSHPAAGTLCMDTFNALSLLSKGVNLDTEEGRRQLIKRVLNLAVGTTIAPNTDELQVLTQYILGRLTTEETVEQLDYQEHV